MLQPVGQVGAKHKVSQLAVGTFQLGNVITGNNGLRIPLKNMERPRFCCSPLAKWLQSTRLGRPAIGTKFSVCLSLLLPTCISPTPACSAHSGQVSRSATLNGRPRFSLVYLGASDPTCTHLILKTTSHSLAAFGRRPFLGA